MVERFCIYLQWTHWVKAALCFALQALLSLQANGFFRHVVVIFYPPGAGQSVPPISPHFYLWSHTIKPTQRRNCLFFWNYHRVLSESPLSVYHLWPLLPHFHRNRLVCCWWKNVLFEKFLCLFLSTFFIASSWITVVWTIVSLHHFHQFVLALLRLEKKKNQFTIKIMNQWEALSVPFSI